MEILDFFTAIRWFIHQIHPLDITISLLTLFILLSIYQKLTSNGPMIWPVVGFLPNILFHFNDLHDWNTSILSNCGGTYRFSGRLTGRFCNWIVTADPVKVEYMLKTRFTNFPKGEFYRERFRELLGDGIFNADGDKWKLQRRLATSEMHTVRFVEFSLKSMQWLVHHKLLNLVEKHAANVSVQQSTGARSGDGDSVVVDLQQWLLRFTFDNVCMVAMGVDPGCLDIDLPEIPFAQAFEAATEYSLFRFLMLPFLWKGLRVLKVGTERKLLEAVKIVHEFADDTVKKRRVESETERCKNDLLSRLIMIDLHREMTQQLSGGEHKFCDKFLRDFCVSFILAGRDTSSVGLAWFFWLINKHPFAESKIVEEIHHILRKRGTDNLSDEPVFEAEELNKMVYLEAALTETLRLYPPVPVDFKEVVEDDVYPDGTWARSGDRVFYHTYAMGRMESIWGRDAAEFKPERWIKKDDDLGQRFIGANPFKYVVFNAGPRLCVGKKFAYTQMKMVAASILLRFEVKVVENQVIKPKITTTLYMKNGLLVTFHPRRKCDFSSKVSEVD